MGQCILSCTELGIHCLNFVILNLARFLRAMNMPVGRTHKRNIHVLYSEVTASRICGVLALQVQHKYGMFL